MRQGEEGGINTYLGRNAADVEAGAAQCGVLLHAHSLHTQLSSLPNTQFSSTPYGFYQNKWR
jgi:hypothetical protein